MLVVEGQVGEGESQLEGGGTMFDGLTDVILLVVFNDFFFICLFFKAQFQGSSDSIDQVINLLWPYWL